jgi:hypothetical protein
MSAFLTQIDRDSADFVGRQISELHLMLCNCWDEYDDVSFQLQTAELEAATVHRDFLMLYPEYLKVQEALFECTRLSLLLTEHLRRPECSRCTLEREVSQMLDREMRHVKELRSRAKILVHQLVNPPPVASPDEELRYLDSAKAAWKAIVRLCHPDRLMHGELSTDTRETLRRLLDDAIRIGRHELTYSASSLGSACRSANNLTAILHRVEHLLTEAGIDISERTVSGPSELRKELLWLNFQVDRCRMRIDALENDEELLLMRRMLATARIEPLYLLGLKQELEAAEEERQQLQLQFDAAFAQPHPGALL